MIPPLLTCSPPQYFLAHKMRQSGWVLAFAVELIDFFHDQQKIDFSCSAHSLKCWRNIGNYRHDFSFQLIQKALQLLLCRIFFDFKLMNSVFHFSLLLSSFTLYRTSFQREYRKQGERREIYFLQPRSQVDTEKR